MKKLFIKQYFCFLLFAFCFLFFKANAQRYAVIDTKYILSKLPQYKTAEDQLKDMGKKWQKEIDSVQAQSDSLLKNYESEQYMLTDELKKKRQIEVQNKEKEVRDLQTHYFGDEGELFRQRQILIRPIQDKIYGAAQRMALTKGYDFILDKSEGITIIFADPKLNRSDDILQELGVGKQ
jgi:outer membrane protein